MADAKTFACALISPENVVFDGRLTYAEIPGHDGQVGLMHDRAPLMIQLAVGKARLVLEDGSQRRFFIDGGFAQMTDNQLTLLSHRIIPAEQLDPDQARAALAAASALKPDTDEHFQQRQHDLAAARTMLELTTS